MNTWHLYSLSDRSEIYCKFTIYIENCDWHGRFPRSIVWDLTELDQEPRLMSHTIPKCIAVCQFGSFYVEPKKDQCRSQDGVHQIVFISWHDQTIWGDMTNMSFFLSFLGETWFSMKRKKHVHFPESTSFPLMVWTLFVSEFSSLITRWVDLPHNIIWWYRSFWEYS